jgi:hypothetical protein
MTAVGPVGGILYMVQTFIIESKTWWRSPWWVVPWLVVWRVFCARLSVGSVSKFLSIIFPY